MKTVERFWATVDRIKESKWRYAFPWSMTLAKPILGGFGVRESWRGHRGTAEVLFIAGAVMDKDGTMARALDATSAAGAIGDVVTDGMYRAEELAALAPEMPKTVATVTAGEILIIGLNAYLQRGREKPLVPQAARVGTFVQSAGGALIFDGLRRKNESHTNKGKAGFIGGTGIRLAGYGWEYWKMRKKRKFS